MHSLYSPPGLQPIYCLDTYPGVGKTTHIIEQLSKFANDPESKGYCFYVAPTEALLEQTRNGLINNKNSEGKTIRDGGNVKASKIFTIHSLDEGDYGIRVPERIRAAVTGTCRVGKLAYNSEGDRIETPRLVTTKPAPEGSLLLITHEGFIGCSTIPESYKNLITVYFDEARKFVVPSSPSIIFEEEYLAAKVDELILGNSTEPFPTFKLFDLVGKPKVVQNLQRDFTLKGVDQAKAYLRFLTTIEHARNPMIDLYIHYKKAKKISKDQVITTTYSFISVGIPSRVFNGYRYVLLASAYLSDSQMFCMLKKDKANIYLIDYNANFPDLIKNLTLRESLIRSRITKLVLVPLTADTTKISKSKLKGSLILKKTSLEEVIELVGQSDINTVEKLDYFCREFQHIHKRDSMNEERYLLGERLFKNASSDVINFLANQARRFFESKEQEIPGSVKGTPLIVVNLDAFDPKGGKPIRLKKKFLSPQKPGGLFFKSISSSCHGLNEYTSGNCIAYLSAINPSPEMARLLKHLYPAYDPDHDFCTEAAAQAISRLSIRDVDSIDHVYAVIPDLKLHDFLMSKLKFAEEDLSVVNDKSFITLSFSTLLTTDACRSRSVRSKDNPELARLRKEKTGIQSNLAYYVGKTDDKSLQKFDYLEVQLKKLTTAINKEASKVKSYTPL